MCHSTHGKRKHVSTIRAATFLNGEESIRSPDGCSSEHVRSELITWLVLLGPSNILVFGRDLKEDNIEDGFNKK